MTDSAHSTIATNGARPKRRRSTKPRISTREAARLLALRDRLEQHLEAMVAFLDELDGDPDLEPQGDEEPSLGSVAHHGAWSTGALDDREEACEDEGAEVDDEGCPDADLEPSLGWTLDGSRGNNDDDREHDPADLGEPEDAF